MRKSLKQTLIDRDNISELEAESIISEAQDELMNRLDNAEDAWNICEEFFDLEPDYLEDLIL